MDYRERKYYIVRLNKFNESMATLRRAVPSLEQHQPYNHFPRKNDVIDVYDGDKLRRYVQTLLTCKKEDSEKLINTIKEISSPNNHIYIKELTKDVLGQ